MPGYAVAYKRITDGVQACQIFDDWPEAFQCYKRLDVFSKTIYEIVQGPDEPTEQSSAV